jgi:putative transposase
LSTGLARRFDMIWVENLDIGTMTRSATGTIDQPGKERRREIRP